MNNTLKWLAALATPFYLSQVQASITVIDFDRDAAGNRIDHGQIVDDEYKALGVTITSVATSDPTNPVQVAFRTGNSNTSDPDLEFNNDDNAYNIRENDTTNPEFEFRYTALQIDGFPADTFDDRPGNILIIQNTDKREDCDLEECPDPDDEPRPDSADLSTPAGYFEFSFDFIVDLISIDTFDFEESNLLTAQFFDEQDNEISTGFRFEAMIDGGFRRQDFSVNGVKRLVLNLPGSGAIDNLVFETAREVPAPGTLAIIGLALLYIGRKARR